MHRPSLHTVGPSSGAPSAARLSGGSAISGPLPCSVLLQVITLEGWVEIMYYVMDAHSFYNFIYFILLIIVSVREAGAPRASLRTCGQGTTRWGRSREAPGCPSEPKS